MFLLIAVLITGCTDSGGPKDATGRSHDAGFDQTFGVADSLYSRMQFRDAYKLYLQLTLEGTRWGAAPNQQLIDRRMALAKMASVLAQMGRSASGHLQSRYYQQADSAYEAWKAVQYEGNHTRDYFIVDYMKKRGRYQEAVPIYNHPSVVPVHSHRSGGKFH